MRLAIDLAGRRFERLTAIERSGCDDLGKATYQYRCDRGKIIFHPRTLLLTAPL
ncbi:hypothetical protein [Paraburkholderia sp. A1RO-5L]|uniref:hypothetical protein n=1 Tax=Paraburkholderia sp. A1RO-5L TaxID=3028370 RepID=UPI003B8163D7